MERGRERKTKRERKKEGEWEIRRERGREVGIPSYLLVFKIAGVQIGSEYGLRSQVI